MKEIKNPLLYRPIKQGIKILLTTLLYRKSAADQDNNQQSQDCIQLRNTAITIVAPNTL